MWRLILLVLVLLCRYSHFCDRAAKVKPFSTFDRQLAIRFFKSGRFSMASLTSEDALFRATVMLSSATATRGRPRIETNDILQL
mmetsp:Transcript_8241/g.17153  ORF Transcript_8241/g.17153 Transcript_8241/m.17153 type:complete len:84 (+) Transcript_8241:150-401(+)